MNITDPLLTARESAIYLQISVPTFWRRVADGTVPKPVKIGSLSRWPRSEIIEVIETAKAQRNKWVITRTQIAASDGC